MAEIVRTGYRRLFEVRVLHHYYLDDGFQDFTALNDAEQERRLLSGYDVRQFLSFTPTASTEGMLKGLDLTFRTTPAGFLVAAPDDISIPSNLRVEVIVEVQHPDFLQYTALTLPSRKIVEIQEGGQVYRFKERVPVFSNSTGTKRNLGGSILPQLYLSAEIPNLDAAAAYPAEALVLDGSALYQAIHDTATGIPAGDRHLIDANKDMRPVYVHQDDAPPITPPGGLVGAPARGIELTPELPDNIFALIRIDAMPADTDFQVLSGGMPKTPPPVFEIHFKNRSTFWRYFDQPNNQFQVDTSVAQPLPLTIYGQPGPFKPSPDTTVRRKKATPAQLTIATNRQLFSDIIE